MPNNFCVYYLYSKLLDKYYLGKTNDLNRRILEHNLGQEPYTKRGLPWILIGYILCDTNQAVVQLEIKLKKQKNKQYVYWFIKNKGILTEEISAGR